MSEDKKPQVYYAAGWKPEPYIPREEAWADSSPHVKLSDYNVVRSDANATSWKFECHVTGKDYQTAWTRSGEEKDIVVSVEDGCIVLKNPGEETGAYLKLPKTADAAATPIVDKPERGGLFVTLPKKGATAAPEPLSIKILGMEPRVIQDRAPPLQDELDAITERQKAWLASGKSIPGIPPGSLPA